MLHFPRFALQLGSWPVRFGLAVLLPCKGRPGTINTINGGGAPRSYAAAPRGHGAASGAWSSRPRGICGAPARVAARGGTGGTASQITHGTLSMTGSRHRTRTGSSIHQSRQTWGLTSGTWGCSSRPAPRSRAGAPWWPHVRAPPPPSRRQNHRAASATSGLKTSGEEHTGMKAAAVLSPAAGRAARSRGGPPA